MKNSEESLRDYEKISSQPIHALKKEKTERGIKIILS
jgi:hypothetical protein